MSDILKISTFLDPHFKTNYVKGAELTRVKDTLIEEASDRQDHLSVPAGQDCGSSSSNPPPPKKRNLGTMFKEQEQTHDLMLILSPEQFSAELTSYENAPMLDFEEDPLLWWKLSSHKYPTLSELVKKYLAVCATSVMYQSKFDGDHSICQIS